MDAKVSVLVAGIVLLATLIFYLQQGTRALFIRSLAGKHVVVTGGSSGIGFAIAKRAVMEGAFVTLIARTSSNLEEAREILSKECPAHDDRVLIKVVDVSDHTAVADAVQEIFATRPIDVLVCNAGIGSAGLFDAYSVETLDQTVRTNLMGSVYPVHTVLPLMKQRSQAHPSSIVFMSSLAGLFIAYGGSIYAATKFAQRGLAETLRVELIPYNIRVNLICPGYTETPMLDEVDRNKEIAGTVREITMYEREKASSADYVAECTMRAVKRGEFLTTVGRGGFVVAMATRGLFPSESIVTLCLECLLFVPVRLGSCVYKSMVWRRISKRCPPTHFSTPSPFPKTAS